jgi:hypothetical protein
MSDSPVAIVCGYDRFSDLHLYAENVASGLVADGVERVIVTGGFTNRDSWHSEAWLMAQVIAQRVPDASVILEEWAMTTVDNLVFGREAARQLFDGVVSFVVYCDVAHRAKVLVLARIILGVNVTVRAIQRQVPFATRLFEPVSIVCEALCAVAPPLRRMLSRFSATCKGVSVTPRRKAQREAA